MVTREPEWSDDDRNRLLSLGRYEAGVGDCGYHHSLTKDRGNLFQPETDTCPVCAGLARWRRKLEYDDQRARKAMPKDSAGALLPMTPDPADGRRAYMRMLSPREADARRASTGVGDRPARP